MSRPGKGPYRLTPELLLRAYATGIFPMAESRHADAVFWVDPEIRGILPLDTFHVPRSLRKTVCRNVFDVRCDTACEQVIHSCSARARGRRETWINDEIIEAYTELHRRGFVHSVETWKDGRLVGGLYGVTLGGAFFGESMFSAVTDASKVALVHLVARLKRGRFVLLDSQFVTDHLRQFGVVEIPAREYLVRLEEALKIRAVFYSALEPWEVDAALEDLFAQSRTQTS